MATSRRGAAYTAEEDELILKYIKGLPKAKVAGNAIWKQMQGENILKGRPWQGIRNRYLKYLRPLEQRSTKIKKAGAPSSTSEKIEDGQSDAADREVVVPETKNRKLFNLSEDFDGPTLESPDKQFDKQFDFDT